MVPTPGSVGSSPARVDGADKVRGAARYVDDLVPPGCLRGATVRSCVPHGVLRALRRDPAFDWSGVVVVTADEIPGENVVALIEDDQPALVPVGGVVRHVGEPLALVAASTARRAREAAAALQVEIDALPSVHDAEQAVGPCDVRVRGDDNVLARLELGTGDDVEAALARCDLVVEGVYRTGAQEQMYIEPQGMLGRWDGDTCHVVGSLQCPYYVHTALVRLLGLPGERVVVTQAVTGGGFGGKEEYPSMLAAHAALLSRAAGEPVAMVYDRAEDVAVTTKRHPSVVRHRLGLMSDGRMVAADVEVLLDGGAYVTLSPVVLSRACLHASGAYRFESVRVRGRAAATNTAPHGAFRGFGAPQTLFAAERQVDEAAARLGLDPLALRRMNALRSGDLTATGQRLGASVGSLSVLEAAEQAAGPRTGGEQPVAWPPRDGPPEAGGVRLRSPVRRGRGWAFCFHGAGFTGSGEQRLRGQARVATCADGCFEVRSSSTDIGQGATTIFSQIAADALGVGLDALRVATPSTDRVPDSGPTVASRTCMVVGGVVERAARALREQLQAWGRERGLADDDTCALARAHHAEHGELESAATYEPPPDVEWDDATYRGAAYPCYGWAACVVDVAVDVDTAEVGVERCVHAIDVGRAIHPLIVEGQIEGGTLQALGWALLESVRYDERGAVANASMTDCIIPTSADAPEIVARIVEQPYPHGPMGAKGVGEIPMDGPAAAVANALRDALGVSFDELPVLPEVVRRGLRTQESS